MANCFLSRQQLQTTTQVLNWELKRGGSNSTQMFELVILGTLLLSQTKVDANLYVKRFSEELSSFALGKAHRCITVCSCVHAGW